jgi:hypothetical protein
MNFSTETLFHTWLVMLGIIIGSVFTLVVVLPNA